MMKIKLEKTEQGQSSKARQQTREKVSDKIDSSPKD
jgi:hypothetical protein